MTINIDKFNEFLELERQIPLTLKICHKDYSEMIFNVELPPIRDKELEKCLLFVNSGFTKKLGQLKDDCIKEIEQYTFDLPNELLNKYFILLLNRLNSIMVYLRLVDHLNKIRNSDHLETHKSNYDNFNPTQKATYRIITLFYVNINDCCNFYYEAKNFITIRQSELELILADEKSLSNSQIKQQQDTKLTLRQHALIYKYKTDANYIPKVFIATEIRKEFGKGFEKAIYTVWNIKGKNYKVTTAKELEKIIPYLAKYPHAYKAAINDLDSLS